MKPQENIDGSDRGMKRERDRERKRDGEREGESERERLWVKNSICVLLIMLFIACTRELVPDQYCGEG